MGQNMTSLNDSELAKHQFRHQGKLVEALQFDGSRAAVDKLCDFAGKSVAVQGRDGHLGSPVTVRLITPFGSRLLFPTDWVVSNGRGGFVAVNDSTFSQQHEQIGQV